MEMKEILHRMLNHEELTRQETHDILVGITKSEFPMEQVTALLTALQMRGITVDELLGLRDGILETGVRQDWNVIAISMSLAPEVTRRIHSISLLLPVL